MKAYHSKTLHPRFTSTNLIPEDTTSLYKIMCHNLNTDLNLETELYPLPVVVPGLQIQGPALWSDPDPRTWPAPLWVALMM